MIDIDKAKKIAEVISDGLTFEGMRCFLENNDVGREELDEFLDDALIALQEEKSSKKMTNLEYYRKDADELTDMCRVINDIRSTNRDDILCKHCKKNRSCLKDFLTIETYECAKGLRKWFMREHKEHKEQKDEKVGK